MKNLVLAVTFLTRIYIPNHWDYDEDDFGKSIWFYPVVGLILGAILGSFAFVLSRVNISGDYSAFILIAGYVALSGGLHLDGLADVCDGVFSGRSRDKIFEIMKDSRVGTFGVIGLILYFLGLWVALKSANWQMVLLFPIVGRSSILVAAGLSEYAKETGLGKSVVDATREVHVFYAAGVAIFACLVVSVQLVIPAILAFAVVILATKRVSKVLGGITGDVMGMVVELSQVIFLISAVILTGLGAM